MSLRELLQCVRIGVRLELVEKRLMLLRFQDKHDELDQGKSEAQEQQLSKLKNSPRV